MWFNPARGGRHGASCSPAVRTSATRRQSAGKIIFAVIAGALQAVFTQAHGTGSESRPVQTSKQDKQKRTKLLMSSHNGLFCNKKVINAKPGI